jgi:hypothetical protein
LLSLVCVYMHHSAVKMLMVFIVQALKTRTLVAASRTIERREDALEIALQMTERGEVGVRIIGDGRIYNPAEFSLTIDLQEFLPPR